jgi:hypothetical protein
VVEHERRDARRGEALGEGPRRSRRVPDMPCPITIRGTVAPPATWVLVLGSLLVAVGTLDASAGPAAGYSQAAHVSVPDLKWRSSRVLVMECITRDGEET